MMTHRLTHLVLTTLLIASAAPAQTTQPNDGRLDFGVEGLSFPATIIVNGHTPRTAQLLGEAYRRREPLVWKRVQLVAELGLVARAEGVPFLIDAIRDQSPAVRAEAARSAVKVGDVRLLAEVSKLLNDADANVRREAVLSAAALARAHDQSSNAVASGLADSEAIVLAAALQSASTPEHAGLIAKSLAALPEPLKAEAALALGRLKIAEHASAVTPLLTGDVVQRIAALCALDAMANASTQDAVQAILDDPHPTVRRQAMAAVASVALPSSAQALAIRMLADADPTVRQAAANVLTPLPSTEALSALSLQLDVEYAPLHEAVRASLAQPGDGTVRQATIDLAAKMLDSANPRRREDASFVLGRLRSDAALDRHVAQLQFDANDLAKADWPLVAQAAESLGSIRHPAAVERLMTLVVASPKFLNGVERPRYQQMVQAAANAIIALARIGHSPALAEAVRVLDIDPAACPAELRAGAAFAVGMLAQPGGNAKEARNLLSIYDSIYEAGQTKLEALKALGNLRHAPAAARLKTIAQTDPNDDMRWIAHWAYERCSGATMPYEPPSERRAPPVSITDVTQ